jgi:hypothetical protein
VEVKIPPFHPRSTHVFHPCGCIVFHPYFGLKIESVREYAEDKTIDPALRADRLCGAAVSEARSGSVFSGLTDRAEVGNNITGGRLAGARSGLINRKCLDGHWGPIPPPSANYYPPNAPAWSISLSISFVNLSCLRLYSSAGNCFHESATPCSLLVRTLILFRRSCSRLFTFRPAPGPQRNRGSFVDKHQDRNCFSANLAAPRTGANTATQGGGPNQRLIIV